MNTPTTDTIRHAADELNTTGATPPALATAAPTAGDLARITADRVLVFVVAWTANPPGADSTAGRREAVYLRESDGTYTGGGDALAELFRQQARGATFPRLATALPVDLD